MRRYFYKKILYNPYLEKKGDSIYKAVMECFKILD